MSSKPMIRPNASKPMMESSPMDFQSELMSSPMKKTNLGQTLQGVSNPIDTVSDSSAQLPPMDSMYGSQPSATPQSQANFNFTGLSVAPNMVLKTSLKTPVMGQSSVFARQPQPQFSSSAQPSQALRVQQAQPVPVHQGRLSGTNLPNNVIQAHQSGFQPHQ